MGSILFHFLRRLSPLMSPDSVQKNLTIVAPAYDGMSCDACLVGFSDLFVAEYSVRRST